MANNIMMLFLALSMSLTGCTFTIKAPPQPSECIFQKVENVRYQCYIEDFHIGIWTRDSGETFDSVVVWSTASPERAVTALRFVEEMCFVKKGALWFGEDMDGPVWVMRKTDAGRFLGVRTLEKDCEFAIQYHSGKMRQQHVIEGAAQSLFLIQCALQIKQDQLTDPVGEMKRQFFIGFCMAYFQDHIDQVKENR